MLARCLCVLYVLQGRALPYQPLEEVEKDVDELAEYARQWKFSRIYLQGADPFITPYDYLVKVADLIHEKLPQVTSIGGYARVDNVRNKTVE